ncbi:hypothetical protein CEXT_196671 [Caerostris extrusa]|uniref:Uncharacterized protein n=1 Tax=Caerostris extrusa TaxID=172846 RepID=A0AAV4S3N1_CAEEX|nr:hypothetical protein CEXT_196671 [Caerostris extrusa]
MRMILNEVGNLGSRSLRGCWVYPFLLWRVPPRKLWASSVEGCVASLAVDAFFSPHSVEVCIRLWGGLRHKPHSELLESSFHCYDKNRSIFGIVRRYFVPFYFRR